MSDLSVLTPYIPFLIPVAVIQLGLMIAALVHILRHETYKAGTRVLWIVVVVFRQHHRTDFIFYDRQG